MFKAILPVTLVSILIAGGIILGLAAIGVNVHGMGLPVGILTGFCFWPWLFKRLDAAADRGEL